MKWLQIRDCNNERTTYIAGKQASRNAKENLTSAVSRTRFFLARISVDPHDARLTNDLTDTADHDCLKRYLIFSQNGLLDTQFTRWP